MGVATVVWQPDFPAGFLILFGVAVAIATILLLGVLAEVERERR